MFRILQILLIFTLASCTVAGVALGANLFGKPVTCMTSEEAQEVIEEFYEIGLKPLMGFIGYSQTEWGSKYPSSFYIMYTDGPPPRVVVMERLQSGNTCVLTGNTGSTVEFDTNILDDLLLGKKEKL